ncbi:hypothetical protein [Faecalimonas sp.]
MDLTDGIANIKDLKATVEVTIKEEPAKPEVDKEATEGEVEQAIKDVEKAMERRCRKLLMISIFFFG